jgi:hypothetical protein
LFKFGNSFFATFNSTGLGFFNTDGQFLDVDFQRFSDLFELHGEIKAADDRAKKALLDTSRIADELRSEQEHSSQIEKIRKSLENLKKPLTNYL